MHHKLAIIESKNIGLRTKIWQFCLVLDGAQIGSDCNICSHCFIEGGAIIGDNVTIKNGVSVWDGIRIENNVFVGPSVVFSNDKFPRSKSWPAEFQKTLVKRGASIGAGAVILPGITIGHNAMIGAGAVVTRSVQDNKIVAGNPAVVIGTA